MKKNIITSLTVVSVALVLFFGINVGSGCACFSREDTARGEMHAARKVIVEEKKKNGVYPTYEELFVKKMSTNFPIYKNDEKKTKDGLVYSVSSDGNEYVLKGYMAITFFGIHLPFTREIKDLIAD